MKKLYVLLFLFFAISLQQAQAQLSILFVDDTADSYMNAETFHSAIEDLGYTATYFNAQDSSASPTDLYMSQFDLVVWHTASQSLGLQLWNGNNEDNGALTAYLLNGGKLWLVGNDFLYARYSTPYTFSPGDFVYDVLGIASYDFQTYNDDGNTGVPQADPAPTSPISGLPTITWQFATLWYGDGVSKTEDAQEVYEMGDDNYVFADSTCAVYLDNGIFQTLTYTFDIALANNFELIKSAVAPVLDHFSTLSSNKEVEGLSNTNVEVFPNPTDGQINLKLELKESVTVSAALFNLQGQPLCTLLAKEQLGAGTTQLPLKATRELPNGTYILKVLINGESIARPVILQQ